MNEVLDALKRVDAKLVRLAAAAAPAALHPPPPLRDHACSSAGDASERLGGHPRRGPL